MIAESLVGRKVSTLEAAVAGSLIIALLAQVAIPLYFTPVPITGQTLGVMLVGLLFGPKGGFYAALAYLMEGAAGLPVFAGGQAGPAVLMGMKGGYYLAFPLQAYLAGCVRARFLPLFGIALLQMAIGTVWLALFVGSAAWGLGFLPFISGEALKVLALTAFFKARDV